MAKNYPLGWGLAILGLFVVQLVQQTAASTAFFACTLIGGAAAWDPPVYSPISIDTHAAAIFYGAHVAAVGGEQGTGIIGALKDLFMIMAPPIMRADYCFDNEFGSALVTDAAAATFNKGGNWRYCSETDSVVQVAPRDVPPPADDHVDEEEIDVDSLLDAIVAADQEENEAVDVDELLDSLLAVYEVEYKFIHADELIDDLLAADRAQYERAHMAVALFVDYEVSVPGAVVAAFECEEEAVELLVDRAISQDEAMADLAVDVACAVKEKVELHAFSPVIELLSARFLQELFLQRLGILTPKGSSTAIFYGLVLVVIRLKLLETIMLNKNREKNTTYRELKLEKDTLGTLDDLREKKKIILYRRLLLSRLHNRR